ncbi:MAG: hypothetical protein IIX44_11735 [Clostridia bacterium]|nr:hypothetical protein [Clostridia bacterium]
MNGNFKDLRLIEAFDYIDPKYIAEVGESLKLRSVAEPQSATYTKPSPFKYWKQYAALVACVLLLSMAFPVFGYIAEVINSYASSGTTVEITEAETEPYDSYVLTEGDLAQINEAYRKEIDLPATATYKLFDSVESAMRKEKYRNYYFGKYGDTIVLWNSVSIDGLCCFELGGYSFDFYTGTMLFFNNGVLYKQSEIEEADILTSDEIDYFYGLYVDYYVPFAYDPHICPEFTEGIELLSEAEMRNINKAYDTWKFDMLYPGLLEEFKKAAVKNTAINPEKEAEKQVRASIGCDPHRFFREKNLEEYRYYGKFGNKYVLFVTDEREFLTTLSVAGQEMIFTTLIKDFVVYADGEFTGFAEAYERGMLTADDVALVYQRHLAYNDYLDDLKIKADDSLRDKLIIHTPTYKPSPIILPEDEIRRVVWDYIQLKEVKNPLEASWSVRCYAARYSTYAVMVGGPFMYAQMVRTESVAGYTFTFSDCQVMYIYKDGAFYRLEEAYSLGIVDEEFIGSIIWDQTKS